MGADGEFKIYGSMKRALNTLGYSVSRSETRKLMSEAAGRGPAERWK